MYADLVLKNANILTMDKKLPKASALAIAGERIIGVGAEKDFASLECAKVVDCGGLTAIPGFNDSHAHPVYSGACLALVNLTDVRSIAEFLDLLKARADVTPAGEWVEGFGYDEGFFAEGREPNLEEIDRAIPDHPVYVARSCHHVGVANSRALKLAGFNENTPDPPGGELVRKDGRLTGRLNDAAAAIAKRAVPMPSTEVLAREFGNHCHRLNSLGITSSTEMGMLTIPDGMGFWNRVAELGNQTVRVAVYMDEPMYSSYSQAGLPFGFGSGLLRFQGRKILLDGGGGSGTARVSEPNLHDGKSGILYYTQEKLDSMIWEAHSKGRQVAVHAIGDVAIDMLIESYEKAYNNKPNGPMHRIEHAYFCFPPLLEKLKRLPVAATLNPGFIYYFGETHIRNYGIKRTDMEIPIRSFIDSNVLSALGSDNPVTVPDPFPIIYSAVSRKTGRGVLLGSGEAISIREALWAYTAASAALTGEETEKGTLSPGKLADITLLDKDPESFEKEPEGLLGIAVKETYLGGKLVFGS